MKCNVLKKSNVSLGSERLLLREVSQTSELVARRLRKMLLAALSVEVKAKRIGNACGYLESAQIFSYENLRFELYTDPELLLLMLQQHKILGMPVPLKTAGMSTSAVSLWGRCKAVDSGFTANRVILNPSVVISSGVFFPQAIEQYSARDHEVDLLSVAVTHRDLGLLHAGQMLCQVPGSTPHMLLCQVDALEFSPKTVDAVILENIDDNRMLSKLLKRQGIPVIWST